MITLTTGVPGAGKTLYALNYVKELSEKEKRPVFYSGIKVLDRVALPWEEMADAQEWYKLPKGSIVVVDEAQRIFRPRGNSVQVPKHVSELETHRHLGVDIVMITQHPMLIDSNIRRLVGQHFHVIRRFGTQKAVVHEFSSCSEITPSTIASAVRHDFAYPVDAFNWYKSAEVHTHKRRIPARMWFLWFAPLIIAGLIYIAYARISHFFAKSPSDFAASVAGPSPSPTGAAGGVGSRPGTLPSMTAAEWLKVRTPRVAGLAYTAPVYDEMTKPTRVPVPAACVGSATRCQCYSQDGTKLDVDTPMCRSIVERGFFREFDESKSDAKGKAPPSTDSASPRSGASAQGGGVAAKGGT